MFLVVEEDERTADFVAPPFAPAAGMALLKEKTVNFLSASPVKRVCPDVRRRWKRLMAVGADDKSRKSCAWSSVAAGGGGATAVAEGMNAF